MAENLTPVSPTGLAVGDTKSTTIAIKDDQRLLMRLDLRTVTLREPVIRDALNRITAVDVVDDPSNLFHEATPYENLLVIGDETLAQTLRATLPRYFSQVAHRYLAFNVKSVVVSGPEEAVYFGRLVDHSPGASAGTLVWRTHGNKDKTVQIPQRQDRHAVLLGDGALSSLFPTLDCGHAGQDKLIVLEPGDMVPRVRLADALSTSMLQTIKDDSVYSVVRPTRDLTLAAKPTEGCYSTSIDGFQGELFIYPDSAFSRVVQQADPNYEMLQIVALHVPAPGVWPRVQAVRIQLSGSGTLSTHLLQKPAMQIVAIGAKEKLVIDATGRTVRIGGSGAIDALPMRLVQGRASGELRSLKLEVVGDSGLGWIRLPCARRPTEHSVNRSELRYSRAGWVSARDTSVDGNAIYLDWLDSAVTVQVLGGDDTVRNVGLATFLATEVGTARPFITSDQEGLVIRDAGRNDRLEPGKTPRFGPLAIRYRPVETR